MNNEKLVGTKVALINNDKVLAILRDDKPNIDFPGMWDFPGGARDDDETPMQVATREIKEELGLELKPEGILWQKAYPAVAHPGKLAVFVVFHITNEQLAAVVFGDEGKEWKMMTFDEFLSNGEAVPGMQQRLHDYLVFAGVLR